MKKELKKLFLSIMAVTTMAISTVGMSTNANNTEDFCFNNFYIPPSFAGWVRFNHPIAKTDNSPVFLYISKASRAVRVQVIGVDRNNVVNYTPNESIYCTSGVEYLISNSVYPMSSFIDLRFSSVSDHYGDNISGYFNPDGYTYV